MAASEDELAKQRVQEAVWVWAGRGAAMLAVFVLGFFAAWWTWGYGPAGAPHLRELTKQLEAQTQDFKNKNIDVSGRLTVTETRLQQCQRDLEAARRGSQ